MRLSDDLVLIPDVVIPDAAVFHPDEPSRVPDSPPQIAIGILSPDDRLTAVREKLGHYKAWECPTSGWLIRYPAASAPVTPGALRSHAAESGLRNLRSSAGETQGGVHGLVPAGESCRRPVAGSAPKITGGHFPPLRLDE